MSNNHKIITRVLEKPLFSPFKFVSIVEYPPDCGWNIHHKHTFFQILSVLSGEFDLWDRSDNGVSLRPGDFLVIPSEWLHSWRIEKGCRAFQISFSPFLMEDYGELSLLFGDLGAEWKLVKFSKDVLAGHVKKIEDEFDSDKPASSALIHSYLIELFAAALRIHSGEGTIEEPRNNDMTVVKKTLSYIQNHYRERITVKALARNSYLGESRFFQVFREHTGTSPLDYVCKLRMEKAKMLLIFSHMSISQIADYLGYNSIHYFSRTYKKYYKVSPSKNRAM